MKKLILIIILQFPLLLFSQKDGEFIKWNDSRKLVWDDFRAAPQKNGDVAALTATHLGFSYNVVNGKISYNIECRFEKNKSWGLVKNDWILKHEQGHFDIAEIFARKLFKVLSEYRFNKNSFQKDLDAVYKKIVSEKENFQQEYDVETDFSRNKNSQEKWLKKIEAELLQFKSWAGYQ
jgi:hypothetical protein